MGDTKLGLLLLSTVVLAYAQEEQPTCLLAKRYKAFHKYEYQYEAESLNAINGASQLRSGPKGSCKVEIEVPQSCSYILRTTGCTLSEVVDTDAEGHPVFGPAAGSDAFAAAMEKNALKVVVEGVYDVKLYPEEDESITILNIKRGIVSALAVPLLEEDKNTKLPTIHGICKTIYSVKAREDIATDIILSRDLSKCDSFTPQRDHTSPLALISGMHYPLSQLVKSSQLCNYQFDNDNKHMTSGTCTEKHILLPFSHKGEYGLTNTGKQSLALVEVSAYNDRVFDHNEANVKGLAMEADDDKSAVQDKDAALAILRELATLSQSNNGEKRAHLFQKLVTMARRMKQDTLSAAIPEALEVSGPLTYQVLAQCGTPECSSAIMKILRTLDTSAIEVDATVFAMGLLPNPSALLVKDMLAMAQYKQSKPIMYALSNAVKSFYKAHGKLTPEIYSVAEFMAAQLGDCSGDKEQTFMTLRVIGNMAAAIGAASPALRTAVIQCVNQPAASPEVQQAAIQAYRLTPVPEEGREVLMQVLLDGASPLQKRVAAYLVLMKDPQSSELARLAAALPTEENQQAKSFVISHLTNILASTKSETLQLREKILDALQGNKVGAVMDPTKFSRNYRIGSVEGNMIFEGTSYLPKEVMLETTLKAFGFEIDIMEVGIESKGLEPTVESLFGEDGFFPDTALKTIYFVSDKLPQMVNEVLKNVLPTLKADRRKRQTSQNFMREIGRNVNKLVRELKAQESPEAMVYLRLLGNELGYLKTKEMEEMAISAVRLFDNLINMFRTDLIKALVTKEDNEVFAHYMFMDNEFFLPTATGLPLRIALSGTFTPGIKGGMAEKGPDMAFSFMPSAGVEFVTQFGSHIPDYVMSGLEMHTNLYHESGLRAKIGISGSEVKLSIPAPQGPTKLISVTNSLVAVTTAEVKTIPPMVEDIVDVSECSPVIAGMEYCTVLQYTDASSHTTAPYFPLTGDSMFAVVLHPTGEVSEYTATIAYELLMEGDEGRQKVDTVKMVLKAEGKPMEATVTAKYNRRKNVLTTDIQIPDYDLEAGLRLGVVDGNTKGKGTHSISIDLINKNIPQLSLVGRAKIQAMKDAMLQVQLLVPSLQTDATVTANLKRDEELELELQSDIKLPLTNLEQKISLKYDNSKIEAEVKSDMNSEIQKILPQAEAIEKLVNEVLDMQVGQTDMKVRHILTKSVEATNNYLEKYAADMPYMQNLRVPAIPEVSLPANLFLNIEAKAAYHFNDARVTFAVPLPLGGKSTEELNFPPALTTPHLSLPQFGLELQSMQIPIPELYVPETITVFVPLFGKAEVSTKLHSNLYDLEASASAGKDDDVTPSYSATFDVTGSSQVDILSMRIKGSGLLVRNPDDSIKAEVMSSVTHTLIDASISILEVATVGDMTNVKSSSNIKATSPLGLDVSLEHTGMVGFNAEEISANSNLEGTAQAGPVFGKAIATQSFAVFPFRQEAKIDHSLGIDSTLLQAQNTITATFVNGELSFVSKTNAFEDLLTQAAELALKENQLSLKCDTNVLAFGINIRNQAEASAGAETLTLRMETNSDYAEDNIYSLITAHLDVDGLAVNTDANVKLFDNKATHKATLTMNKDGLSLSGNAKLNDEHDVSKATLSNSLTINRLTLSFTSEAEAIITESTSYTHDITIALQPYTASMNVKNDLRLLDASLVNEAQLNAELYKIDCTGSLKAAYNEEEIKHTYEINYADLTANAKCSTTGKLLGSHMSHNTELEVVGLAATIYNDARFNSQPLRFDHTIRASVIPFDFNLDAVFNADGDLTLYGKQGAQLYGKLLLKAQPLALASSHEYRASVTHRLIDDGFSLETTVDNKMDTLITPQEQMAKFRLKSKVNDHALNQEVSAYNNAERLGLEVSGTLLTDLLNSDASGAKEFTISGLLKYDKNTESHMIQLPLIESLPAIVANIKVVIVSMAEALQNYLNDEDIKAMFEALPQHVSDFVTQINLILSDSFSREYAKAMEELEAFLANLGFSIEKLARRIWDVVDFTKEMIVSGTLSETVIQRINQELNTINEEYDISSMIVAVIDAINGLIRQMENDEIKEMLERLVSDLKRFIENFDRTKFVEDLRNYISSINLEAHFEELMAQIPTDTINIIVDYVKNMIQEFDVIRKFRALHRISTDFIVNLEVDKKVLELIRLFKIDETIQAVANKFKSIHAKVMQMLSEAINYLRNTEMKHLNEYLDSAVQKIKSFNYNAYVDDANQIISEYTTCLNEMIKTLEIPQKFEATREFVSFIVSSAMNSIEQLKQVKVVDMIRSVKDFIDFALLNDLRSLSDRLKQNISEMETHYFNDIKQVIMEILDFIIKFEIPMTKVDAFFGDMTMNYMPALPEITLPEITLPEISFPAFPTVPVEKLLEIPTLQIPGYKLPTISSEVLVPCFGKLYGEIKVNTPIYSLKTSAELKNATKNAMTPQFTASLTSQATSPNFEILNYNLDSTARVAIPKMSRVIVAETLKFAHSAVAVDHQASVTLYGMSAQASAKTTVKVTTDPYTADIVNSAFFAMNGGMSASLDTTYNHQITIPITGLTSEASLTQKAVVRQEAFTVMLNVGNEGSAKIGPQDSTHKSDLQFSINPRTIKLIFSGDTDIDVVKIKQTLSVDGIIPTYIKFNARSEAEGPAIKNSLVVASGDASLSDMKAQMKANHDTELVGDISGVLSNAINVLIRPAEVVFDFQNKGTTKISVPYTLNAKIDLQNDYSATINPYVQHINTMALARFNQYKYSYNFTVDNNEMEASIHAAVDGEANVEFLTRPIHIPEIELPFIDFHTQAIDLNLYEYTGMKHILTTTEQNVGVDAKIVYQKNHFYLLTDILDMGIIRIPLLGNIITELSFKSAIFNLNANAGLNVEEDLVFRLAATSTSLFEALKAKLDCTTSLTTTRGLKLATALSLDSPHIEGTHDSSITLNTDNMEADVSVSTVAKVALPILNLEANQQFVADNKDKVNAASTLKLKGDFHLPLINAIGKAEADHSLKLDGTLHYISMEISTKGNLDGTVLDNFPILAALDNEANVYLNADGLRSTSKIIANAKINNDVTKTLEIDVDENLAVEASLSRVYAVLKFNSNNNVNCLYFITGGKHVTQATIDLAPTSLAASYEIDMSQQNLFEEIVFSEKAIIELSALKQKISSTAKIASMVYSTSLAVEVERDDPVVKVTVKSSATSPIVFLEYDMDGSISLTETEDGLSMTGKFILTHTDLAMDIQQVLTAPLSVSQRNTLNVDITSPTFTDMSIRYAARRDGFSASISTPSTGFLALQLQDRTPSQQNVRLYSRYASAPEDDVEILIIRTSVKDADMMNLHVAYNMEATNDMLQGLKERLPAITSTLTNFADKYDITHNLRGLRRFIVEVIEEVYSGFINYEDLIDTFSRNFRDVLSIYCMQVRYTLDNSFNYLKEIQFKLPGSEDMTTLFEVLKQLDCIDNWLEKIIHMMSANLTASINFLVEMINNIQIDMPTGEVMTGRQILEQMDATLKKRSNELLDLVKYLESLDINSILNSDMDMVISLVSQFNNSVPAFLEETFQEAQADVKVSGGKLEIDLPFPQ